ncbi:MAG: indolepyruvate oxidoreductase subunit beta [Armatimonadota bacterium]|nr:indolepyruvate oxidoreductase subunit beta [Armatimonadota bacterium]MDR5703008.1 indolepyruvate oxidoreductase subunit beta [Armatimonadota bacterium]
MKYQIVVAGVGGQGVLLTARILAEAAMDEGQMVWVGEVHGMAQRGGSVVATVRIGDVWGPLIKPGGADALVALELAEALRCREYLSPRSIVVVGTRRIPPVPVNVGQAKYPSTEEVLEALREVAENVVAVDAVSIARSAGMGKAENMVLLGVLAGVGVLPLRPESLLDAASRLLPPETLEANRRAFFAGMDEARRHLWRESGKGREDFPPAQTA